MTNATIITMSKNCPDLVMFHLCIMGRRHLVHITDESMDEGFRAIIVMNCKKLTGLAVSGLLTDKVFEYIATYGKLVRTLSVAFAGNTNLSLMYMLEGCHGLQKLEIRENPFGDAGFLSGIHHYYNMRPILGWASRSIPGQTSRSIPGQTSRSIPGQTSRSMPGQTSSSMPGKTSRFLLCQAFRLVSGQTSRLLLCQAFRLFSGQVSRSIPGQTSRAIPDQVSRSSPGQTSRSILGQVSKSSTGQAFGSPPGRDSRLSPQCEL
ncbi:hypothetical protein ZIOFF_048201 [Zingiber officinale]|uniref:Uncharacterized protein n=1 Tax=Zingiber officinale TaxID=94328 RepID=A0A8J5FSX0_ZINOF|nr:hypothetical protein ZIOFF_048201 [Zingiber officinale]